MGDAHPGRTKHRALIDILRIATAAVRGQWFVATQHDEGSPSFGGTHDAAHCVGETRAATHDNNTDRMTHTPVSRSHGDRAHLVPSGDIPQTSLRRDRRKPHGVLSDEAEDRGHALLLEFFRDLFVHAHGIGHRTCGNWRSTWLPSIATVTIVSRDGRSTVATPLVVTSLRWFSAQISRSTRR